MHCGRCGYLTEYHDEARRCPGLKTGQWQDRDPIDRTLWRDILSRDARARERAYLLDPDVMRKGAPEAVRKLMDRAMRNEPAVVIGPPLISPRPPQGPHEFAGARGLQAVGLGKRAAGRGMDVAPFYGQSAERVDWCAVKGYRPSMAFVARWERKPGATWGFDLAYTWNPVGGMPIGVGYTALMGLIV